MTTDPFVALDEVREYLRKRGTNPADDETLTGQIAAACQMIVDRVGEVTPVDVVQISPARWGRRLVILDRAPVVDVQSVTVLATGDVIPAADPAAGVDGWRLDGAPSVLAHTAGWPVADVAVAYTAGRDPVPANIILAAKELAGHLWKQSQLATGGARPPINGDDQVFAPGAAYALPYRVRELLGLGKLPTSNIMVG